MQWESIIGLEVHVQLATETKIFSNSSTKYGAKPNTQICEIDAGLPGVLPVLNQAVIDMAIKFGLSVNGQINHHSYFERKNYFYPDLPKGYQISQNEKPIIQGGYLNIPISNTISKRINIHHAHLEEDAGKSNHELFNHYTAIDLNRTGNPLLEIVTTPELTSANEAVLFLKTLHKIVRTLKISNANMQEGSFRCDANISIRPQGRKKLGTKTEIKNMNSFKFIENAINYEIIRQIDLLETEQPIVQETRLYDPKKNITCSMRSKENATDYRYFPEPDLPPILITEKWIQKIKSTLPELPLAKQQRFITEYSLKESEAQQLCASIDQCDYFETIVKDRILRPSLAARWILTKLLGACNKNKIQINKCPVTPEKLKELLLKTQDNTISETMAKTIFDILWQNPQEIVDNIIKQKGFKKITNTNTIEELIDKIINNNPMQVTAYKNGKTKLFGFFVGQVMKDSKGQADPKTISQLLKDKLNK